VGPTILQSGISNPTDAQDLSLYPNPASEFFTLAWSGTEESDMVEVEVSTVQGQGVRTYKLESASSENRATLNISDWTPGTYWVKVSTGTRQWIRRLIVLSGS
jgi:hypothetical protein